MEPESALTDMIMKTRSITLCSLAMTLVIIAGGPQGMIVCLGADNHVGIALQELHSCCGHGENLEDRCHGPSEPATAPQTHVDSDGGCTDIPLFGSGVILVPPASAKVPIPLATFIQSPDVSAPGRVLVGQAGHSAFWRDDGTEPLLRCTILLI